MANDLGLKESELSPRELTERFTDTEKFIVSEASVYRILKSYDLITSPAYVAVSAADEFKDKTTRPNELWQADFTYPKVLVLSQHDPGRLQPIHHRLEALHDDEDRGCDRHARSGIAGFRLRSGNGAAQTAPALGQRPISRRFGCLGQQVMGHPVSRMP